VLSGLAQLSIELSSGCDKTHLCNFCGRQDPEINPIAYGFIDFNLLVRLRDELEPGPIISFHRDGEPTAYPRLAEALALFANFTTSVVTHGLTLARRAHALIGHCTTLTVSVFRGDPDALAQYQSLKAFLEEKGDRAPQVQVKVVGDMNEVWMQEYEALGARVIRRLIHIPSGNAKYAHRLPTIPEVGVCLDALSRPSVGSDGRVYLCNRLDPMGHTYIGDLRDEYLDQIWNGPTRKLMVEAHKAGNRAAANPLCATCEYWGVASE
jgi:radical SAM protein with 4Fe4S-binding SPASM domain